VPAKTTPFRYAREIGYVVALLLPYVALIPLGFLFLWREQAALWWMLGATVCAAVAFLLRRCIAKTARAEAEAASKLASPASRDWTGRETEAWRSVEAIARETEPFSFTDEGQIRAALTRVTNAVAEQFHPGAARAHLRFSLPELLLLAERLARDLRGAVVAHVPGARQIQLDDVLWLKELYDRHGAAAKQAYDFFTRFQRIARLQRPESSLLGEAGLKLTGSAFDSLSLRMRAELTAIVIRETGRAAIDLYSGRLRLTLHESRAAARAENAAAQADLVGPVRILLGGQVNAGKSSLLNAMAGGMQRAVGALPTPDAPAELMLERDGKPEVVLIDAPGLGDDSAALKKLLEQRARADLILWVVSATQPARARDVEALRTLRGTDAATLERPTPPLLCAVTHIDALRPAAEWAPPYDLAQEDRPKARSIRDAVAHVGAALGFSQDEIAPVCVRDVASAYNIDLLWSLTATRLDGARAAKLARLRHDATRFSSKTTLAQLARTGRWLARAVWSGGESREPPAPRPES
jgi:uncharacterized protein